MGSPGRSPTCPSSTADSSVDSRSPASGPREPRLGAAVPSPRDQNRGSLCTPRKQARVRSGLASGRVLCPTDSSERRAFRPDTRRAPHRRGRWGCASREVCALHPVTRGAGDRGAAREGSAQRVRAGLFWDRALAVQGGAMSGLRPSQLLGPWGRGTPPTPHRRGPPLQLRAWHSPVLSPFTPPDHNVPGLSLLPRERVAAPRPR